MQEVTFAVIWWLADSPAEVPFVMRFVTFKLSLCFKNTHYSQAIGMLYQEHNEHNSHIVAP